MSKDKDKTSGYPVNVLSLHVVIKKTNDFISKSKLLFVQRFMALC